MQNGIDGYAREYSSDDGKINEFAWPAEGDPDVEVGSPHLIVPCAWTVDSQLAGSVPRPNTMTN